MYLPILGFQIHVSILEQLFSNVLQVQSKTSELLLEDQDSAGAKFKLENFRVIKDHFQCGIAYYSVQNVSFAKANFSDNSNHTNKWEYFKTFKINTFLRKLMTFYSSPAPMDNESRHGSLLKLNCPCNLRANKSSLNSHNSLILKVCPQMLKIHLNYSRKRILKLN